MSASNFPDLAVGVLRLFSLTPHPTPLPSPTMPSSSLSEKLLRDTLLRDERERQQRLSSSPARPIPKRRHSYVHTSSGFVPTKEDYGFRTARSSPRSPSPSSLFSLGKELENDGGNSPVGRRLFDDEEEEHVLRGNLERALTITESDAGSSRIMMRRKNENDFRGEQGGLSWKRDVGNEIGSMKSDTNSPLASQSNSISKSSYFQSQSNPHTPEVQIQTRTHNTMSNRVIPQRNPYYSPSTPHSPYPYSPVSRGSPSFHRTDLDSPPPNLYATNSPRRDNSSPSGPSFVLVPPTPLQPTKQSPRPLLVGNRIEQELRLPTPPPSPLGSLGSVPSRYGTAIANPGMSSARKGKEKGPPRPLNFSRKHRHHRDATITQHPLAIPRKCNSNEDSGSESCSTGTSVSSVSYLHAGYSSSYSSLGEPLTAPLRSPPQYSHDPHQSQSNPSTPRRPFNARIASTQCRAIQGYVSFANVEGLGEPPLVRDEYDGDESSDDEEGPERDDGGRNGSVPFLPLGMLSALGWKSFLGGDGVEGSEPGVVV